MTASRLRHVKRTSEEFPNAMQIPDPNNLGGGRDDSEVFEGSELILLPTKLQPSEVMISCIQTTSVDCSLVSLWLIL